MLKVLVVDDESVVRRGIVLGVGLYFIHISEPTGLGLNS